MLPLKLGRCGIVPEINSFTKEELITSIAGADGFKIERESHPENGKAFFLLARKLSNYDRNTT
eukprot:scaffold17595_cov113-Cylindrotheca_fusiformis.AAC.8